MRLSVGPAMTCEGHMNENAIGFELLDLSMELERNERCFFVWVGVGVGVDENWLVIRFDESGIG